MPDIRKIIIHQASMDTEVVEEISRAVEELYLPNLKGGWNRVGEGTRTKILQARNYF